MESLEATLRALRVDVGEHTANPLHIYRSHVTELLASLIGAPPDVVYPALQWTQTLAKGDLLLAVPALRLKSRKPDQLALTIQNEVCTLS